MKSSHTQKLIALFLAAAMAVGSLTGCAKTAVSSSTAPVTESSSAAPAEPAPAEPAKMEGDEFNNGAIGKNGGVSSSSEYSSQIGIDILKAGGNAVDAAVATSFAIGVVEPYLSGIGGCGFMNVYLKESHTYEILEYMETTPAASFPGMMDPDKPEDTHSGKNVAIPGQVHGLLTALEKYGTMSREEVMAPAIKLAEEGWIMDKRLAEFVVSSFDWISKNPELLSVYTNDGLPYSEGDTIKNPNLANSLKKISKGGIDEFYKGELAKTIVDGLQTMGSLITMEDMAAYTSMAREPIRTTYHGYEVVVPPPPSNGGDWLLEMLNIMESYDLKAMGMNSPEYLFTFNEASRLALADSYAYIGDPAFFKLPIDEMISKEYTKKRVAQMPTDNKVLEKSPAGDLPVERIDATAQESLHTSHIAVIDQFGNIVSTTNTLGNAWGSCVAVDSTGFAYNSHMSNLEHDPAKADSPDYIMPGKRVRSTVTPTLVLKDGEPIMAVGSPGSLAIPPAIAMVINNVLLFDMNIQQAINAPRAMAIDRSGPVMTIEDARFDAETLTSLEAYGYELKRVGEYNMATGGIAAIYLDKSTGTFYAGGDPRRNYKALAY